MRRLVLVLALLVGVLATACSQPAPPERPGGGYGVLPGDAPDPALTACPSPEHIRPGMKCSNGQLYYLSGAKVKTDPNCAGGPQWPCYDPHPGQAAPANPATPTVYGAPPADPVQTAIGYGVVALLVIVAGLIGYGWLSSRRHPR